MPRYAVSHGISSPQPAPPPVPVGTLLQGRFRLAAIVGRGGTGTVYRALDALAQPGDREVAIKVAHGGGAAAALLLREARCLRAVPHPHIVRLRGLGRDGPHCFLVLGLVQGDTLATLLRDSGGRGLPAPQAMRILADLGGALGAVHRSGFVHGDLKPGNVLIGPDGRATLIDFGTAQRCGDAQAGPRRRGAAGRTCTPAYASPSQLKGRPPDPRDDVYSLAVITYAMVAGRHPFAGRPCLDPPRRGRMPTRPPHLDGGRWVCLRRGLARTASARHADGAAFAARFGNPRLTDHLRAGAAALAAALT